MKKSRPFRGGHVRYNTYKCNLVKDINGREIPVFHIHGEKARKYSMVLSYYSYADGFVIKMFSKLKEHEPNHIHERE